MEHDPAGHEPPPSFWSSRYAVGLVVIGGVAAYFLFTEHLAHVVGALPFLLLLACPLMHVFMHHGHGGHGGHGDHPMHADEPPQHPRTPKEGDPL